MFGDGECGEKLMTDVSLHVRDMRPVHLLQETFFLRAQAEPVRWISDNRRRPPPDCGAGLNRSRPVIALRGSKS